MNENRPIAAPRQASSRPPLWPFSSRIVAVILVSATILLLFLFNRHDSIDRAVSAAFFVATDCPPNAGTRVCGYFPAAQSPALNTIRDLLHFLPVTLALVLVAAAIAKRIRQPHTPSEFVHGVTLAVSSLILTSLVVVNLVLKEYSGRPRPAFTDLFGGEMPFVPAGEFTNYCATNCSFVSGEASTAFWLLCLVPMVAARYRLAAFAVALIVALAAATLRIAFGGHYLSDVVIGALLSLATFAVLANLFPRAGAKPAAAARQKKR